MGLTIQKTDAWIIPENSDPAPRVVAPVEEAQEAEAAPRPEETQGMRLEREARDLCSNLADRSAKEDSRVAANVEDMRNQLRALGALV